MLISSIIGDNVQVVNEEVCIVSKLTKFMDSKSDMKVWKS